MAPLVTERGVMADYTVKYLNIVNSGEAIHVPATVTDGKTTKEITHSFNSLPVEQWESVFIRRFEEPAVPETTVETGKGEVVEVVVCTPDAARVAAVSAYEGVCRAKVGVKTMEVKK